MYNEESTCMRNERRERRGEGESPPPAKLRERNESPNGDGRGGEGGGGGHSAVYYDGEGDLARPRLAGRLVRLGGLD